MKRRKWLRYLLVCSIGLLIGVSLIAYLLAELAAPEWNAALMEEKLGLVLPADATNVVFDGFISEGYRLDLNFIASPESTLKFARQICPDDLHSEYDPFEAENTSVPWSFAHPVRLYNHFYYSYSVDRSGISLGGRCMTDAGYNQITIHEMVDGISKVRLEITTWCNECYPYRATGYQLPPDLPLVLYGVKARGNQELELQFDEFCVSTTSFAFQPLRDGDEVTFALDNRPLATSIVGNDGQLTRRTIADGIRVKASESGNVAYFCIPLGIGSGQHRLRITMGRTGKTLYDDEFAVSVLPS